MAGRRLIRMAFLALGLANLGLLALGLVLLMGSMQTAEMGGEAARERNATAGIGARTTFRHDSRGLPPAERCTDEQRSKIDAQLGISVLGTLSFNACQDTSWLRSYFEEEADIGSDSFLGISVGCNTGSDAVRMARMGTMDPAFDGPAYETALETTVRGVCARHQGDGHAGRQAEIRFPKRGGEVHCIEPLPRNVAAIRDASKRVGLDSGGFVVSHAAISSADGVVGFPDGRSGSEWFGMDACLGGGAGCVDVPVYSLDSYAERFVGGDGPINILQIDVEGFDFDVLFGASSTLDRTFFLEFEYHEAGNWGGLHLQDAVKLLNGKGFTCYWESAQFLWRITGCYFDLYDRWHGWSNVACVHRSQARLAARMEEEFLSTLAEPVLDEWCPTCVGGSWGLCAGRLHYLKRTYGTGEVEAMRSIVESGKCVKPANASAIRR